MNFSMAQKQIAPTTQIIRTPIKTEIMATPSAGTVVNFGDARESKGRPSSPDHAPIGVNSSDIPTPLEARREVAGGRWRKPKIGKRQPAARGRKPMAAHVG
jgi:hypothetical protein